MHKILFIVIFIFGVTISAQTPHLKIAWDPNNDGNVTAYNILRGVSPDNLQLIETVNHPTDVFDDFTVSPNRRYYYSVQAVNGFGLTSSESPAKWGEIITVNDLTIAEVDTYDVNISWTSEAPYQTQLIYGSSYPLENYSPLQTDLTTQHQVLLQGLNGQTTFYFSALSIDPQGNVIASTDTSFTTAGVATQIEDEERLVIAYPNPYKGVQNGMFFDGLEPGDKVMVYNLGGGKIWESDAAPQRRMRWEVNTQQSEPVGSGVYVYIVKNEQGKKVASGKVVIVR